MLLRIGRSGRLWRIGSRGVAPGSQLDAFPDVDPHGLAESVVPIDAHMRAELRHSQALFPECCASPGRPAQPLRLPPSAGAHKTAGSGHVAARGTPLPA